ncbi:MAG: hypothetical protein RIG61_01270 [Deltaproteobacteria bacterium]
MILERIKPELDTPEKIRNAYSIFSSWLFSNFIFFFVIFYALYLSYRLGSYAGSYSLLIIVIAAMAFLYFMRKIFHSLLKGQSVRLNHIVFYVLILMNTILLVWILRMATS